MLKQMQRSWVTSTFGLGYILSFIKNEGNVGSAYVKIQNALKEKKDCIFKTIMLYSADYDIRSKKSTNSKQMQIYTDKQQATNLIKDWINTGNSFINIEDKLLKNVLEQDTNFIFMSKFIYTGTWNSDGNMGADMKIYNSFNYTEDIKYEARVLELPMRDKDFKLVIIVPNEIDVMRKLFSKLTNENLTVTVQSIHPLFTVTSSLKTPHIEFVSEERSDLYQRMQDSPTFTGSVFEFGNVKIDENGSQIKVISCVSSPSIKQSQTRETNKGNDQKPFYFAVTFKDRAIIAGQYVNTC